MRRWVFGFALLGLPAAAQTATEAAYLEDALGLWSSAEQSSDPGYDWVQSEKWRILEDRTEGVWIYQENAIWGPNAETVPEEAPQPYFQVVIQFRDLGQGLLHTTTYRVKDRAGALSFSRGEADAFDADWIGEVACMGLVQRIGEGFWNGQARCPNGYKGGVRVESYSVRAPGQHVNWDRGFNAAGEHIWGPAEGGYIFKRREDAE
ncbi:MAG: CpcT/CpeT family chromophore lyase [Pseudomonadota bacterium]